MAVDWARWWPAIRAAAARASVVSELDGLTSLTAAALEARPDLTDRLAVQVLHDPALTCLAANAIDQAIYRPDWTAGSRRVVEVFGLEPVVAACLDYLGDDDPDSDRNWNQRAFGVVDTVVQIDSELGWTIVLALVDGADDDTLPTVAAGPLENYVTAHAARMVTRIEAQAEASERFRDALAGIWVWADLPSTLFERIARAAGNPLDRPASLDDASRRRAERHRLAELTAIVDDPTTPKPALHAAIAELNQLLDLNITEND